MSQDPSLALDPRLTPARPDLADIRLRGRVEAARFTAGEARRVAAPSAPLRCSARAEAGLDTEAVMGDPVTVYDARDGLAYVQLGTDGYVGYLPEAALGPRLPEPTHRVTALRTFLYPEPDMKRPALDHVGLGARVAGEPGHGREGAFLRLASGAYLFAGHAAPLAHVVPDPVATAERLVGTPYLWGGRTSLGLDCSGLVQLCQSLAGRPCPRDADQQEAALGRALPPDALDDLRRGDLVFWRGHVGMMCDPRTLIHANGHHMSVAVEPLEAALARIARTSFGAVTGLRRIDPDA